MKKKLPVLARIFLEMVHGREPDPEPEQPRIDCNDQAKAKEVALSVEHSGDVQLVSVSMETLSCKNIKTFKKALSSLVATGANLVLDLSVVKLLDSTGLGVLLSTLRRLNEAGGDLKICAPTPTVRKVIEICRVHKVIDVFNTREQALRACSL